MFKKGLVGVLGLLLWAGVMSYVGIAEASVTVSLPEVSAEAGATGVDIPISVDKAEGITGFTFTVTFNPAILQARGNKPGELNPGWTIPDEPGLIDNVKGEIRVGGFGWPALSPGSGSIAKLIFDVVGSSGQSTALAFTVSDLSDAHGVKIPSTSVNGRFTIRAIPGPTLSVSPLSLDFGTTETQKTFAITNTGAGTLEWNVAPVEDWISVHPASGSTPAAASHTITVTVNRVGLAVGPHSGRVNITSNGGNAMVAVTLTVPAVPTLSVHPTALDFGTDETQKTFAITNTGTETLTWSVAPVEGWISVHPASGSTPAAASHTITVTVNRTGLAVGIYSGRVNITSNGGNAEVTVAMEVPGEPILEVTPILLEFGTDKTELSFAITNPGTGTLRWEIEEITYDAGVEPWLRVRPLQGTTTTERDTVTVNIISRRLPAGLYFATIPITSNALPGKVEVTMRVEELPVLPITLGFSPGDIKRLAAAVEVYLINPGTGIPPTLVITDTDWEKIKAAAYRAEWLIWEIEEGEIPEQKMDDPNFIRAMEDALRRIADEIDAELGRPLEGFTVVSYNVDVEDDTFSSTHEAEADTIVDLAALRDRILAGTGDWESGDVVLVDDSLDITFEKAYPPVTIDGIELTPQASVTISVTISPLQGMTSIHYGIDITLVGIEKDLVLQVPAEDYLVWGQTRHLARLTIPHGILEPGISYRAQVEIANRGIATIAKSALLPFHTVAPVDTDDPDNDGIPDEQEIDEWVDMDEDGVDDREPGDCIAALRNVVTGVNTAVQVVKHEFEADIPQVARVESLRAGILPGKPGDYDFPEGMYIFRIEGLTPGSTIHVKFYLSRPFGVGDKWWKYDTIHGWQVYATAGEEGGRIIAGVGTNRVTLKFVDGGYGDADGVADGVIVDPSGPGRPIIPDPLPPVRVDPDRFCFIATATFGTPMAEEVVVLRKFRDEYLLTNELGQRFVSLYYRHSPALAEFIREREGAKRVVRVALWPLVRIAEFIVGE